MGWWSEPYPSEKFEFVSWDDDIPNIWKNEKRSKPPTSTWFDCYDKPRNNMVIFHRYVNVYQRRPEGNHELIVIN